VTSRAHHVARYARPGDAAAVALLVEAAESAGTAHWYEAAIKLVPEDGRADLLGPLGLALAREGRLQEARGALTESGEHPLACARLEALLGDRDAAKRRLRAAYAADPDPALAFELALLDDDPGATHPSLSEPLRDLDDEALEADLPVVAHIARTQLREDRIGDAAETSLRALAIAARTRRQDSLVPLHEIRATVLWLQLDLDGALAQARAAEEIAARQGVPYVPRLRALLHHDRGEVSEAEQCMAESVPGRLDPADRWAAHVAELALPESSARATATVLLASGDALAAAELAERAAASAAPLDATEARLLAGRAHAAAGARERAKALLQQVAADAARGGALRLRDEAARELRRLGTRVAARNRHAGAGDLTHRERTVAELVAEGRSNKQVAAALFLSEGTIENTLTRIYAKLGVRSRTQLTGVLLPAAR
jgi:DNA-binding NarL/FixJ family response regulator